MSNNQILAMTVLIGLSVACFAKDKPEQVINWPNDASAIVRFNFGKFRELGSLSKEKQYTVDVEATNLWSKTLARASFSVFMFDKAKVRIGEGYIDLSDVPAGQSVKFDMSFSALGTPASMSLVAKDLPAELQALAPPKTVSIAVYSVPSGATVTVDGKPAGATPLNVSLTTGPHKLEFSKEGFNKGVYPLQIRGDEGSAGSISYELGSAAHDTIELRDGTVVEGDLESVTPTDVTVTIGGKLQSFDRNQVKRILLIERQPPPPQQ